MSRDARDLSSTAPAHALCLRTEGSGAGPPDGALWSGLDDHWRILKAPAPRSSVVTIRLMGHVDSGQAR